MYITAEVIAISVWYRKIHVWEELSPHTLQPRRIVLIKSRNVYMMNHSGKMNIFITRYWGEAYVCNIIRLIVIILAYQNLHRPKYCWNTNLWPYWFKRLPHSMQNWYFVTAVVGNKIWKLPKTWMVFWF